MLEYEQERLLEKALALYYYSIRQHNKDRHDNEETNEFAKMVDRLEDILGTKLYYD